MALTLLAANNAQTVLAAGINSSATTMTVNTGTGALFPTPSAGANYFKLTLIDAATGLLNEIVHVTARTGDTMTIVRAQEGTTARAWSANDIAANMMTAGSFSVLAQLDTTEFLNATTGRLLTPPKVFTSSGTYTPTAGMKFCIVKGIGGGGAGGGAPATAVGNVGLGAGGHAGAYGEGQFTAAQIGASQTVTVGSGGTGSPTSGGNGGSSSLGSLITFGGGSGASSSGNTAPPINAGNGNAAAVCTGANIISGTGPLSLIGQITSTSVGYSGTGASSSFGSGGGATNTTGNGMAANGYGAGGGGAYAFSSNATARSGGNGSPGFVIIFEYA
ncbi:glycine-rich domain-containing protein [Enterobacter roggenkampii]|uniref:glycine-rich domain-containing protein n=1 Tax=Enterobacter roggenkampii TaxID=1812935 RepID=UPI003D6DF9D8